MREILFRGKRIDNGEWVYGDFSRYSDEKSIIMVDLLEEEDYWVSSETVGQDTGLKDKNGKKIFEGDVVEFEHGGRVRAYVIYKDGSFEVKNDKADVFLYLCVIDHKAEVIGNIHDIPN